MALRSIEFTNGEAETTVFGTSPYLILRVEGLGIPGVDTFQQKAPNQDGTTYIDSLLQNRDLVIEIAITTPNAFMDIAAYRRQLSQRLCPKYGIGNLLYTDEAGHQYSLSARASSVVFPNKDYRDPYARAQITFTAHEPYWRDVAAKTGTLPTSATSVESTINGAATLTLSVIELSNGNLFIAYSRTSDAYLVSRTYTTSWSSESVINSAGSISAAVIELANGNLFVVYRRTSDNFLISREYTSSWSAETVINAASSYYPTITQLANGNLFVVYRRTSDNYLVSRTYTTSWSGETVINAAASSTSSIIERPDGSLFVVYNRASDGYLMSRTYTSSWSAESTVNADNSRGPSLIERSDGSLLVAYNRVSDSYIASRTYATSWSSEGVISGAASSPSVIELSNKSLFIAYTRTSDSYLVSVTRSVTPVPQVVIGDVSTPVKVTFQGPSVNPRIIKQNTLEYIRLNTTLAATDSFVVDTTFGNKTVKLLQGGIEKNGIAFLDIGSTFFQLDRPTLPALPIGVDPWYGNVAYYAMENIPEIPNDPAGVTYLQDAWATVDGWGGSITTLSVSGGRLISTISGTDPTIARAFSFSGNTYRTIRIKFRQTSGTVSTSSLRIFYTTSSHSYSSSYAKNIPLPDISLGNDYIIDTDMSVLTVGETDWISSTITGIRLDLPDNAISGQVFEIDWIYIGTGAYLPNSLLDSSGNANHGTIYGATPVDDGGLIRDGINDYEVTVAAQTMPSVFWYHELWTIPNNATEIQILYGVGVAGDARLVLARVINSTSLSIVYWNGTADTTITIAGFFPSSTELATADIIVDWITGIISVYKNGAYFASATMALMEKPAAALWYFGNQSTLLGTEAAAGTVAGRRIFNRAPKSAKEVLFIYNNPDTALPVDADVVYYEDDSVASTAVATLEYTERYTGI